MLNLMENSNGGNGGISNGSMSGSLSGEAFGESSSIGLGSMGAPTLEKPPEFQGRRRRR